MFIISLILFIIDCGAFCYLFYRILELQKDIDTLYKNYSEELEKLTRINLSIKRSVYR